MAEVQTLDWSHLEEDVSTTLLGWVYTDTVSLVSGEQLTILTVPVIDKYEQFTNKFE